jgi:hypothetical protein
MYTALRYVGGQPASQPAGRVDVHSFIVLMHMARGGSVHVKPPSTEHSLLSWTCIQLVHRLAELLVKTCAGAQSTTFAMPDRKTVRLTDRLADRLTD